MTKKSVQKKKIKRTEFMLLIFLIGYMMLSTLSMAGYLPRLNFADHYSEGYTGYTAGTVKINLLIANITEELEQAEEHGHVKVTECVVSCKCGEWEPCINETSKRRCVDENECGYCPDEEQSCILPIIEIPKTIEKPEVLIIRIIKEIDVIKYSWLLVFIILTLIMILIHQHEKYVVREKKVDKKLEEYVVNALRKGFKEKYIRYKLVYSGMAEEEVDYIIKRIKSKYVIPEEQ